MTGFKDDEHDEALGTAFGDGVGGAGGDGDGLQLVVLAFGVLCSADGGWLAVELHVAAVLVGAGTLLADNPSLNVRYAQGNNPS